ncbi:hypothetical protein IFO69_19770 [Echinicola sp. CAU 1574]|uniref:Uncharacterized protein n=1 Tax=Echinicola arenosa TaxID=2774144 RepID=A0ABR9ARK6_9BACT|nr:hypothetical protein [Echinicola arenosa]MBD8491001.1 hypothetical protein [Echinicola arenosa]
MTAYSLGGNIAFGIKVLAVISGLILFFFYLKPFKKITLYFSIYPLIGVLSMLGLIFRGIVWALVLSVVLFPLIPDEKEFEENEIIISTPFQGFMAPCCPYEIKERQLLILEKNYGKWELEGEGPIDFETVEISSNDNEIEITYSTNFDEGVIKKKKINKYGNN